MANNERQSIDDRIAELQRMLPVAIKERRRRFLEACAYFALADPDAFGSDFDLGLDAKDTAALDEALDLFTEASAMVLDVRTEIQDKEKLLKVAKEHALAV